MIERMLFKSDCGRYLCRSPQQWGSFEAWTMDGSIHWRNDDRMKCWDDNKLDWHPFEYCVGGFSAGPRRGGFSISLFKCDPQKIIIPWTGNTVVENLEVAFRRRVPWQNRPGFLRVRPRKDDPLGMLADDGCALPPKFAYGPLAPK